MTTGLSGGERRPAIRAAGAMRLLRPPGTTSCLLLAAILLGCQTVSLLDPAPIPYSHDSERVRNAIVRGAGRSGWIPEDRLPGGTTLFARYSHRADQYAVVRIEYGEGQIKIHYAESSNLSCSPAGGTCKTIHRAYNRWVQGLRSHVEQALFEPEPRPLHIAEALSIIRQVLEEQPRRNAPASLEVTEERILIGKQRIRTKVFPVRGVTTTHESTAIYFNSVGRLRMTTDEGWHVVHIHDLSGARLLRVLARDETKAKAFVDAMRVMREVR